MLRLRKESLPLERVLPKAADVDLLSRKRQVEPRVKRKSRKEVSRKPRVSASLLILSALEAMGSKKKGTKVEEEKEEKVEGIKPPGVTRSYIYYSTHIIPKLKE
jgi:hypothetical protein